MTKVDLIALGFVALPAFIGWKKGLISSALSLTGIVLGAWLGSRLAPQLLQDGTHSPYTPLAALAGAAVGAILFETLGTLAGSALRSRVRKRKLSTFDAPGGLILGAFAGVAVVWVLGAVAHRPRPCEHRPVRVGRAARSEPGACRRRPPRLAECRACARHGLRNRR